MARVEELNHDEQTEWLQVCRKGATTSDYRRLNLTVIQHHKRLLTRALERRGLC
jgi:hypothetical protein